MRSATITIALLMALLSGCGEANESDEPREPPAASTASDNSAGHHDAALSFQTVPEKPQPNQNTRLEFAIRSNPPVRFEPIAEHPLHFFAVNREMTWKEHLHPEAAADVFAANVRFPAEGEYAVFVIYKPLGRGQNVNRWLVHVGSHTAPPVALPLSSERQQIGQYVVALKSTPTVLLAGDWSSLVFTISRDNRPVTYLTPTGSLGHIVILREGASDFVYSHSTDGEAVGGVRGRLHSPASPINAEEHGKHVGDTGPDVTFHTRFPQAGRYKIWAQFQAGSDIIEPEFAVEVVDRKRSPFGAATTTRR